METIQTDSQFDEKVFRDQKGVPIVVLWRSDAATQCQALKMILSMLNDNYEGLFNAYEVDLAENGDFANRQGIEEAPTLTFYKNGKFLSKLEQTFERFDFILDYLLDYKESKPIHPSIYLIGSDQQFFQFQKEIDRFLFNHRFYKLTSQPYVVPKNDSVDYVVYDHLVGISKDSLVAKIFNHIEYYQFPSLESPDTPCHEIPTMICDLKYWGMISSLHFFPYQLQLTTSKSLMYTILQADFSYGKITNLFLPVSKCDNYDYKSQGVKIAEMKGKNRFPSSSNKLLYYPADVNKSYDKTVEGIMAKKIKQFKVDSMLDLISMFVDWSIRPSAPLRQYMAQTRKSFFNATYPDTQRCVSMHVRHGDKFVEDTIYPFSFYHDALMMLDLTGIHKVFLMTDDPLVVETAKTNASTPELQYIYIEQERTEYFSYAHEIFNDNRDLYGFQLFTEIDLASDCEYFIGSLSSNIDRMVIELARMKKRNDNKIFKYINIDNYEYIH
eukprot:gene3966-4960_t